MKTLLGPLLALTCTALALPATTAAQCTPDVSDLVLFVTPSVAQPGEAVQIFLANTSTECTYWLPTSCLFVAVHVDDCGGDFFVLEGCDNTETSLPPGAVLEQDWGQFWFGGTPVDSGLYAFPVVVKGPELFQTQLCGFTQVGTGCVQPFAYGTGSPGSGGFVPGLSTLGGLPQFGNQDFAVAVTGGLGGAGSAVLVSLLSDSLDLGFGTALVNLNALVLAAPLGLSGTPGQPGAGIGILPLPIPNAPSYAGLELFFQAAVLDPGAGGGLALTDAVRIALCP